ncbi:hypothetical protein LLH23_19800 [bacterium]|nr:hypothetical protein [bacterium]
MNGRLLLVVCCLLGGASARAADPSLRERVQVAWTHESLPLRVPMKRMIEITAPGVPGKAGQLVVLRLQARLDCPPNSGWNKFLALEINGQKVYRTLGGARRGPERILNRDPNWAPAGYEQDYVLFRENQLCVIFAPDFQQFDHRVAADGTETFWYVLDVGDLINPEAANVIRITNIAQPVWFGNQEHDLVIGDLSLGYLPATVRAQREAEGVRPLPAGTTAAMAGGKVTLTPEGGLAVQVGREHYVLETSLTWPEGELNWLGCADRLKSEPPQEWKILSRKLDKTGGQVVAAGKFYRLTRTLKPDGPRLRVTDRIDNLSGDDLGAAISYDLTAGGPLDDLRLAGDRALSYVDTAAPNPTLFAAQKASGLGWLAEDDLLRLQLRLRDSRRVASAFTSNFGLPKGGSYTLSWTLYPSTSTDYWAFINQVRRDWDVNFTVDGPFAFIGHCSGLSKETPEALAPRFNPRRVTLGAMHPWTNYQYPYDRQQHKQWWREAQARVRQASPQTKCLLMMEPPLESRVHQDRVDADPYRDAMMVNREGKVCFDLGYGPNYIGKTDWAAGYRLVWRYPTVENSWGKYLLDDVKFAMADCGANGMYIDCFSYAFSRGWARYSYDRWDGHTVELGEKTHRIVAKLTDAGLVSPPAQQAVIEAIQAAGGVVVANTEPATANMRKVRINRFVETGGGQGSDRETHLYTPIALGYPWYQIAENDRTPRRLMEDIIANLQHGALYYYYGVPAEGYPYGCVNRMFPFTPRELHGGWLVGEERIITTQSGDFGWGDRSGVKAFHYSADGQETPLQLKPKTVAGKLVYPVTLGKGEIVILERVR